MKKWFKVILVLLFLFVLNFVSHLYKFQSMGLYEDDYSFIGQTINYSEAEFLDHLDITWTKSLPQGRPLGFTIPQFFSFLFRNTDAINNLFLFGSIILTTNSFLSYLFFKEVFKAEIPSILGAILFSLFPADTTKGYLLHLYHIQSSVMFCLLGLLIFIKYEKIRPFSYLFGFLCLITYESPFSLFLFFPFFVKNNKNKKLWISHIITMAVIIMIVMLVRMYIGDGRVSGLSNWPTIFAQVIAGSVMGPVVSMGLFLYGPARTVLHMDQELFVLMLLAFSIFVSGLLWGNRSMSQEIESRNSDEIKKIQVYTISIQLPEWIWKWLQSIAVAVIWLMSSYLLAFTHFPPVTRYGRGTSVHIAATIPASLLAIIIVWGIWKILAINRIYRIIYVFLLAGYLSITIGNRFSIQQDFVKSWTFQKQFWQEVVDLVPDVSDGTVIFVVDQNLPEEHYILSNTWTDYMILTELVEFPDDWNRNPMVLTTDGNWEKTLQISDGEIISPWSVYWNFEVDPENIIVLTDDSSGHLVRVDNIEFNTLSGITFESKLYQNTTSLAERYPTTRLYELMIEEKN